MSTEFEVAGANSAALFSLKLHRGDGMTLIAMNWKTGMPPKDFVGFAVEYREPGGDRFFSVKNRIAFPRADGSVNPERQPTRLAPIQKFRWVHFPRNAEREGKFLYQVSPVFMNETGELSYGEPQKAEIRLSRETYLNALNVAFTRGFVPHRHSWIDMGRMRSRPFCLRMRTRDWISPLHTREQTKP